MARISHSAEQIIGKLREAEVLLGQGYKIPEVSRRLDVTERSLMLPIELVRCSLRLKYSSVV